MPLTNKEASVVLAMIERGDAHHDIAAWFGVNQGRIAEVNDGAFGNIVSAIDNLPPKGSPGIKGKRLHRWTAAALYQLKENGDVAAAISSLEAALEKYDENED